MEKLKARECTELPSQVPFYQFLPKPALQAYACAFGLWFEDGTFDLKPPNKFLNESFPEIKTLKVKEMLEMAWKK